VGFKYPVVCDGLLLLIITAWFLY